jgi:hypothetical protein
METWFVGNPKNGLIIDGHSMLDLIPTWKIWALWGHAAHRAPLGHLEQLPVGDFWSGVTTFLRHLFVRNSFGGWSLSGLMPIQLSDMVIFRGYHNLLWENLIILSNFLGICHTPLWEILSASFFRDDVAGFEHCLLGCRPEHGGFTKSKRGVNKRWWVYGIGMSQVSEFNGIHHTKSMMGIWEYGIWYMVYVWFTNQNGDYWGLKVKNSEFDEYAVVKHLGVSENGVYTGDTMGTKYEYHGYTMVIIGRLKIVF